MEQPQREPGSGATGCPWRSAWEPPVARIGRRDLGKRFLAVALGSSLAAVVAGCDGDGAQRPDGMPEGGGRMPDWMMGQGTMGPEMMQHMQVIHALLVNHDQIARQVDDVPGGIRSVTTSPDTEIAGLLRQHTRQMRDRVERGEPIRVMDPLFREIFDHHEAISMRVEDVPGGVQVTETSRDPQVRLLIRQHARRAVSEFVDQGMRRAARPTPLPEGYRE